MIIKPFEQWRDDKLRVLTRVDPEEADTQKEVEVDCPECGGAGFVDCDCNCPNCDGDMECERCDGRCSISSSDLGIGERGNDFLFTRDQYLEELVAELAALARYTGRPILEPFVEAGMAPRSLLGASGASLGKPSGIALSDPGNFNKIFRADTLKEYLQ